MFRSSSMAKRTLSSSNHSYGLLSIKQRNKYKTFFEKFMLTLMCGLITLFVFKGSGFHSYTSSNPDSDLVAYESSSNGVSATVMLSKDDSQSSDFDMKGGAEEEEEEEEERIVEEPRPRKLMITEEINSDGESGHGGTNSKSQATYQSSRSKSSSSSIDRSTITEAEESSSNTSTILSAFQLGPKISDWDEQRKKSKAAAGYGNNTNNETAESIMMVTGSSPSACQNPIGDHILLKSIKNKMDYCNLHGIKLFYNLGLLSKPMSGFWSKLPLLRELMLANPEVEWLWWIDSDAMITNMKFKLPMERYSEHNMVVHGWEDMVYEKKSWVGVNTGSFLLRNCQWSLDLLDEWAQMGPKGIVRNEAGKKLTRFLSQRPPFEADDQSALVYLLINNRHTLGSHVYMETKFCFHGFWRSIVDKLDQMMEEMLDDHKPSSPLLVRDYGCGGTSDEERWPFITHFVGCKPCYRDGMGSYSLSTCLREMDRTFNFADNQVWQHYGYIHQNLNSSKLVQRHLPGYQNS